MVHIFGIDKQLCSSPNVKQARHLLKKNRMQLYIFTFHDERVPDGDLDLSKLVA
jgi:hypothetical protein